MSRRKLITKAHLRRAYKTILWFYSGDREEYYFGNELPILHDYVTCFYLDFGDEIYKSIVSNYMAEKKEALEKEAILHRENSSV